MDAMNNIDELQFIIVAAGYVVTLLLSGFIVKLAVGLKDQEPGARKLGRIIGKCENLIAITFILANEITGLALIFAAKSILRQKEAQDDAKYYLGGTLVNFCFSIMMGFGIRLVLRVIGSSVSADKLSDIL